MNIDELNKACPDHDRSSCSDASHINAGIDYRYGTTWCRRCEGLHNIRTDARITELETAITVRDTEIARLETDLELARRDAERYRWIRDSDNEGPISAGNATAFGEYGFERVEWFYDDELDAAVDEARAGNWG